MQPAIDSYCYHRYFGDHYPWQPPAARSMTIWDFLDRAKELGVAGVSLESVYLPADDDFVRRLRERLDELGLERVWAWGHPRGLCSGTNAEAAADLVKHLGIAKSLDAKVMRIVGGSRQTRPASWEVHRRQLTAMLRPLIDVAEKHGIVLAMENHIDLLADEMAELMSKINSPWLGVCLDTGNNLRMFEDPLAVAAKLAPWTRATHIKDLFVLRGNPREFSFWPSVPLGRGLVDIGKVLGYLGQVNYSGLLAIEVDFLHPDYGEEDAAVAESVEYLATLLGAKKGASSND
jgi:sugar phosphate isomerase/epimerase